MGGPLGGRDTVRVSSIDVRRWRREGRLRASRQFSWSRTSGGEPSGTINVRTEADAVVLIYRVRSFLAGWQSIGPQCRSHGRPVISAADGLGLFVRSAPTDGTAGGASPCCMRLVNCSHGRCGGLATSWKTMLPPADSPYSVDKLSAAETAALEEAR